MIQRNGCPEPISYIEFVRLLENDSEARKWVSPVFATLSKLEHRSQRQRLLRYGVIVHAMIDTLDSRHIVTHDRPSYPHKLTQKSWSDLKYRVFGVYLKFVPNSRKYLGSPKKRP